ncbi:Two-component sensor protein histidine protein kinase (dhkj) [Lasiodiplodia theobromae]|uniref:Two-component sensor protein histidine protein kinase (dhkj) n=1 Tax=Lasiodiplodia theobromae TaxID=45133 RepID=UPI0015C3F884|nr:Two-component sensor protein histidine protein kinase (dhkj) [Lasiodiplodia theobromae]KAF4534660.1 Two-component sensor protein histidine protein kinase (dhkj) [Lasiodiplodia theobromae]
MPTVFTSHEFRRYLDIDQLPPPSPAYATALGLDPSLSDVSPLCASLDALAEVVAVRLGTFGAFISLHDGITHRLVAGHWSSTSCSDAPCWLASKDTDKDTWLWLANRSRHSDNGYFAVQLDEDKKTASLGCVTSHPHLAYYAVVPIVSRHGIAIGSVFILDVAHRSSSKQQDGDLLRSTARKCMAQLESARAAYLRDRVTSIHDKLKVFVRSRQVIAQVNEEPTNRDHRNPSDEESDSSDDGHTHPNKDLDDKAKNFVRSELQREKSDEEVNLPRSAPPQSGHEKTSNRNEGGTTYRHVFSRAAESLRAGLDVDGVAFLDGLVGFHGCTVPVAEPETELETELAQSTDNCRRMSAAAAQPDPILKPDGSDNAERTFTSTGYERQVLLRRPAECLGISVHDERWPVWINISPTTLGLKHLDESLLQRLLAKFPNGKVWYFDNESGKPYTFSDDDRLVVADDDDGDVDKLSASFPGVRQILFAPLTDPTSLKRLAGCVAWTSRMRPVFTQSADLPLFRTFLSSAESEISRVDAIAAVKQQEAFVSSVSHELRTPLHGILGAVEFLSDTTLDDFQQGLAESIRCCGATLHETLSSVLSYAKINQFERRRNKPVQRAMKESPWALEAKDVGRPVEEAEGLYCSTNIATLCEEVVDVTSSGYAYNKSANSLAENLTIILDIDYRRHWNFLTEPAVLRRIMTNILGNALKYTSAGFVKVSLAVCQMDEEVGGPNHLDGVDQKKAKLLEICVTDSGKGMSEEFLQRRLFAPFTQEDAVASEGVGLGMSIVKSLVSLLGGRVNVKSKPGEGSTFIVIIPMEEDQDHSPTSTLSGILADAVPHIRQRRRTVAFRGFHDMLQDSLARYFREWYQWDVLEDEHASDADVVIVDHAASASPAAMPEHPIAISLPIRPPSPNHTDLDRQPYLLIVEDNEVNLKLLKTFLVKRGHNDLKTAANGQLAVDEVMRLSEESRAFDIIFMDISMPVMDGFQATIAIRSLEREYRGGARPPLAAACPPAYIIALTGLASARDRKRAYQAGVDLVLTKPVKFAELSKVLEKWKKGALDRVEEEEGQEEEDGVGEEEGRGF